MNRNQTTPSGDGMLELFAEQLPDNLAAPTAELLPETASPAAIHCIGTVSTIACSPTSSSAGTVSSLSCPY
jgi:hypothetical protein